MGIFSKLFKKKHFEQAHETDLGNGLKCDDNGNIYGETELKMTVGNKTLSQKLSINTTFEKLLTEMDARTANEQSPESCEREPKEDEIKVRINDLEVLRKGLPCDNDLWNELWRLERKAIWFGWNNIIIPIADYQKIKDYNDKYIKQQDLQKKVYGLIFKGTEYEKNGDIDNAIASYTEATGLDYRSTGYAVNRPYDRLMILYRKKKDKENEIKIIEETIKVLTSENARLADYCVKHFPEKEEEIRVAVNRCERVMGDNGFYCYVPYDVNKYKVRLEKIQAKTK